MFQAARPAQTTELTRPLRGAPRSPWAVPCAVFGIAPGKTLRCATTPHGGAHGLDRASSEPGPGSYVMAQEPASHTDHPANRKEVAHAGDHLYAQHRGTIGGRERVYHAFTTAAPTLDGPSTMTLHASTLDVSGLAADPIIHDRTTSKTPARIVLIETCELLGIAPGTVQSTASAHRRTRCWCACARCSSGSGSACRRPSPARSTREYPRSQFDAVNHRSRGPRAFQEVTP